MPKKTEKIASAPDLCDMTPPQVVDWLLNNGYDVSSALAFAKAERSWTLAETPGRLFWVSVQEELSKRESAK